MVIQQRNAFQQELLQTGLTESSPGAKVSSDRSEGSFIPAGVTSSFLTGSKHHKKKKKKKKKDQSTHPNRLQPVHDLNAMGG